MEICAVVPVKELGWAKKRLSPVLRPGERQALMLAMLEDVLAVVAASPGIGELLIVTVDPEAARLARHYGARLVEAGARDGHSGAVAAAARLLVEEGRDGMLTVPGDVPLVSPREIASLLAAHRPTPAFTIAPSRDERGSNAVLLSPPDAVPLRFGEDSFLPHLAAAEARGIRPTVCRLPGLALDIDTPEDLAQFAAQPSRGRTGALVAGNAMLARLGAVEGDRRK